MLLVIILVIVFVYVIALVGICYSLVRRQQKRDTRLRQHRAKRFKK